MSWPGNDQPVRREGELPKPWPQTIGGRKPILFGNTLHEDHVKLDRLIKEAIIDLAKEDGQIATTLFLGIRERIILDGLASRYCTHKERSDKKRPEYLGMEVFFVFDESLVRVGKLNPV